MVRQHQVPAAAQSVPVSRWFVRASCSFPRGEVLDGEDIASRPAGSGSAVMAASMSCAADRLRLLDTDMPQYWPGSGWPVRRSPTSSEVPRCEEL